MQICILRIFLSIWHIFHILHVLHNDICFKFLSFIYVNFQKSRIDKHCIKWLQFSWLYKHTSFTDIACASIRVWTLAVSIGGLSPYQLLGYRFLRSPAFHHCFFPQLRTQLFTYHHLQPSLPSFILSQELVKKRLESVLLLFTSSTVSSLYCRQEQEAASPLAVWRTLESHTRLVLIHCASIRWWTGTLPTKPCYYQKIITRICRICKLFQIYRICTIKPGLQGPLYSSSTETYAHSCVFIPA